MNSIFFSADNRQIFTCGGMRIDLFNTLGQCKYTIGEYGLEGSDDQAAKRREKPMGFRKRRQPLENYKRGCWRCWLVFWGTSKPPKKHVSLIPARDFRPISLTTWQIKLFFSVKCCRAKPTTGTIQTMLDE